MSRIRADKIVNRAGTGAPELPYGISTPVGLNVAGIVTATGGVKGIGISSAGTSITTDAIQTLNFVGAGNTFKVTGTTVDISISGSGGATGAGMSATGINTGGFFSNPNSVDAAITFNNPDHNYGMFGPVALNATVTVGAGNTFTVV